MTEEKKCPCGGTVTILRTARKGTPITHCSQCGFKVVQRMMAARKKPAPLWKRLLRIAT